MTTFPLRRGRFGLNYGEFVFGNCSAVDETIRTGERDCKGE